MIHPHDTRERLFTNHPGSKRPRYAGEVPGQSSSLKTKNRAKWGRRKRALRRRAALAARVAARGGTGQGGMTS